MPLALTETAASICHLQKPHERCVRLLTDIRKRTQECYERAVAAGAPASALQTLLTFNRELKESTHDLALAVSTGSLQRPAAGAGGGGL